MLVVPLFLSLYIEDKLLNIKTLSMVTILLLTGSMTGIGAVLIGGVGAYILSFRFELRALVLPVKVALSTLLALGLFSALAGVTGKDVSLIKVLWERAEPIVQEQGLEKSNRDYVYIYVNRNPFTLLGEGVGNANLRFSQHVNIGATASFLSLYLNTLYSVGWIGFVLLVCVLALPVVFFIRSPSLRSDVKAVYLLSAYLGWLVVYGVHSEELSTSFAAIYAILIYKATQKPPLSRST